MVQPLVNCMLEGSDDFIETKEAFDNWYKKCKNAEGYVYRGQNESMYILRSSAQRAYSIYGFQTEYVNMVAKILKKLKSNRFIIDKYSNRPVSDLTYLMLLQHYGAPSPLIDFSKDLDVALFFAFHQMKLHDMSDDRCRFDNKVAVYCFDTQIHKIDSCDCKNPDCYLELVHKIHAALVRENTSSGKYEISKNDLEAFLSWDNLQNIPMMYIDYLNKAELNKMADLGEYLDVANDNMIAQKGCFVMYNNLVNNESLYNMRDNMNLRFPFHMEKVIIHKGLAEYVLNKIQITEEDIFPDMNVIVANAYKQFKIEL